MAQPAPEATVRAGAAGPPPTAALDALEVTQAIQDLAGSVTLIAEKRTFVRAYLGSPTGVTRVRGELLVARSKTGPWKKVSSFGTAELSGTRSGSTLAQLRSRRENLAFSLDFRLPEKYRDEGTTWLRLGKVRDADTGREVQVSDSLGTRTATFVESPELRLRVLNLRYTTGTPPVQYAATQNDLEHLESWLTRAYPVEEVDFSSVTVDATATWPFDADQANAQVAAIRALDVAAGRDPGTHYYGMVADGGGFMRGKASAIPSTPDPSAVASGPTGAAGFPWDTDGSYGDWYGGHELAHTFGRRHPGFCGNPTQANDDPAYPFANGQLSNADGAFTGLDVGDSDLAISAAALPGATWHDVMTYCDFQWLSSYAYEGIRARLVAEEALFPDDDDDDDDGRRAGVGRAETAVTGNPVHVSAVVNLTNRTARLSFVTPLPGEPVLSPLPTDSRLTLRVTNQDGATRDEPVVFKPSVCRDPGEDETGLVDTVVSVEPDAAAIELLLDGKQVARFEAGNQAGRASNVRVEPLEATSGGAPSRAPAPNGSVLTWDAPSGPATREESPRSGAGASSEGVHYAVQASTDQGRTWSTISVGGTDTTLRLDGGQYLGSDQVRFRVLTNAGFSQTVTETQDIPVEDL